MNGTTRIGVREIHPGFASAGCFEDIYSPYICCIACLVGRSYSDVYIVPPLATSAQYGNTCYTLSCPTSASGGRNINGIVQQTAKVVSVDQDCVHMCAT